MRQLTALVARRHFAVLTIAGIMALLVPSAALAMERPTPEQLAKYQKNGTLTPRIQSALNVGNNRADSMLLSNAVRRVSGQAGAVPAAASLAETLQSRLSSDAPSMAAPPPRWMGVPTTGKIKVLYVLVAFTDYAPVNSKVHITNELFGNGTAANYPYDSLRNYYLRSSYNKLSVEGTVLGWYTTAYPRSSVSQTFGVGNDHLIKEVLSYYDAIGFDFSQFDNDNDGYIDAINILWTGPDNGWANFWWAYQYEFFDMGYILDGKRLKKYTWSWESNPSQSTTGSVFSPLVTIHETGHLLGLPDLYDYQPGLGPEGGVGGLDMMHGNWGDHNAYSKWLLNWLTPTVLGSGKQTVTLQATGLNPSAVAVMPNLTADNFFSEMFIVQNRFRSGNDGTTRNSTNPYPGDGLLIWHVDARLDADGYDFLYNNSYAEHKYMKLMQADGQEEIEMGGPAEFRDYYFSARIFGPAKMPNSDRYDGSRTMVAVRKISANGLSMTAEISVGSSTQLTVQSEPAGAVITGSYPGTANYVAEVQNDESVTLTAAATSSGTNFARWKDLAGNILSADRTFTFTISGSRTVIAEYSTVPAGYNLIHVTASGVSSVPITGSNPGVTDYDTLAVIGSTVTLRAPLVFDGMYFDRWTTGAGVLLTRDSNYRFVPYLRESTVVAVYLSSAEPTQTLTVAATPESVTIAGANGGDTPYDIEDRAGTLITLVAPALNGSGDFFYRWTVSGVPVSYNPTVTVPLAADATIVAEYDVMEHSQAVMAWGVNASGQIGVGSTEDQYLPVPVAGLANVIQVAAGRQHSLALMSDGTVRGWGDSRFGQVKGIGGAYTTSEQIDGLENVVQIGAGANHSLAIKADGTVWTWGLNTAGQLGDGTTASSGVPVQVEGLADAVQVVGGDDFSAALLKDGTVWTWGANGNAQLGDGSTSASLRPVQTNPFYENNDAYHSAGVAQIAAGAAHMLAVRYDGRLYSWGSAANGQLGNGLVTDQPTPKFISNATDVVFAAAGARHSLAVRSDGSVYAWGANGQGQVLPSNVGVNYLKPKLTVFTIGYKMAAGGVNHSVSLRSAGTLRACGSNRQGQLGDGTTTASSSYVDVAGVAQATQIVCGDSFSLALVEEPEEEDDPDDPVILPEGALYTTGVNDDGQLGSGDFTPRSSFAAVNVVDSVAAADGGDQHTVLLMSDGTLRACGSNQWGQLGIGNKTDVTTFTQVPGLSDVIAVATGSHTTFAITADGTLYACGRNTWGELGMGDAGNGTERTSFTAVPGMTMVSAISVGGNHAVAVKANGTCWVTGRNDHGQLGLNDAADRHSFTELTPPTAARSFSCGAYFTYMLTAAGNVYATGENDHGELGLGDGADRHVFTQLTGVTDVASIGAGAFFAMVIKNDSSLMGCGRNADGELGLGHNDSVNVMTAIPIAGPLVSMDGGTGSQALLIMANGTLWGAGRNGSGQLGLGDTTSRNVFTQITANIVAPVSVTVGDSHTLLVQDIP